MSDTTPRRADRKQIWLLLGPLIAAAAGVAGALGGLPQPAWITAAVTALCAVWWVTEAIPIPATSLIPLGAFPLTGVLGHKEVAAAYGHTQILLLMGGFMLSTAVERSGAHRRLALLMIRAVGGRSGQGADGKRLVLGFMLATAVCSMWISNTATTLMLLPVALAVLDSAKDGERLAMPLLLGIAYAASIGGMGTPVGTPPNVVLMGIYEETTGNTIDFAGWMQVGIPVVAIFIPIAWLYLVRRLKSTAGVGELPAMGPWRKPEVRVLMVFGITAMLWVFRSRPYGGWVGGVEWLLGAKVGVGDATVAALAVVALFVLPDGEGDRMLDWETARKIPWGLLLLFGGGIAIAWAFKASGLSGQLGALLAPLTELPILATVALICLAVTFLTEVTSNTATTNLLMPILAQAAVSAGVEPTSLMVPAALSASCAFMLPVATAPNAIVMGTERITIPQMAREGFALNLAGVVVITLTCWALVSTLEPT
ncbi:MAG: SLC13 family permease [Bradymonadia bacterium]